MKRKSEEFFLCGMPDSSLCIKFVLMSRNCGPVSSKGILQTLLVTLSDSPVILVRDWKVNGNFFPYGNTDSSVCIKLLL